MSMVLTALRQDSSFRTLNEDDVEDIMNEVEKFITGKIYQRTLGKRTQLFKDRFFQQKLMLHDWLEYYHFGIPKTQFNQEMFDSGVNSKTKRIQRILIIVTVIKFFGEWIKSSRPQRNFK
jgi:hypothetical protein